MSKLKENIDAVFDEKLNSVSFKKLIWKLSESEEATWEKSDLDFAEKEYRRFLKLKYLYPEMALVPNKIVDKMWHEHILDTKSYRKDCKYLFGKFIDHYPYFGIYGKEDKNNLEASFQQTIAIYEKHFGDYPKHLSNQATRCQEHACHAPSSCACRTAEACK